MSVVSSFINNYSSLFTNLNHYYDFFTASSDVHGIESYEFLGNVLLQTVSSLNINSEKYYVAGNYALGHLLKQNELTVFMNNLEWKKLERLNLSEKVSAFYKTKLDTLTERIAEKKTQLEALAIQAQTTVVATPTAAPTKKGSKKSLAVANTLTTPTTPVQNTEEAHLALIKEIDNLEKLYARVSSKSQANLPIFTDKRFSFSFETETFTPIVRQPKVKTTKTTATDSTDADVTAVAETVAEAAETVAPAAPAVPITIPVFTLSFGEGLAVRIYSVRPSQHPTSNRFSYNKLLKNKSLVKDKFGHYVCDFASFVDYKNTLHTEADKDDLEVLKQYVAGLKSGLSTHTSATNAVHDSEASASTSTGSASNADETEVAVQGTKRSKKSKAPKAGTEHGSTTTSTLNTLTLSKQVLARGLELNTTRISDNLPLVDSVLKKLQRQLKAW
jgi:hypothetical protein